MRLQYTSLFDIDTNGVLIQKSSVSGNGNIPNDISVRSISIQPTTAVTYYVKGLHESSNWLEITNGQPFVMEGLNDSSRLLMYVKSASGTISMKLFVKGY